MYEDNNANLNKSNEPNGEEITPEMLAELSNGKGDDENE